MRSELKLAPHTIRPGEHVVEIWFNGEFIGQITGTEGPGFKLISKWINDPSQGPLIAMSPARDTVEFQLKKQ